MTNTEKILIGLVGATIAGFILLQGSDGREVKYVNLGQKPVEKMNTLIAETALSPNQSAYDQYNLIQTNAKKRGYYTIKEWQTMVAIMNIKLYEIREKCEDMPELCKVVKK